MSDLLISEIQIVPCKYKDGLAAFASAVINNQFYIGNIGVYSSPSSPDGFRLVYPTKTLNNGTRISIFYPIEKETGLMVQKRIVEEYLKIVDDLTKGAMSNEQSRAT